MEKVGNVRSSLLKLLWHRVDEDDLPGLSAQLAYYFLLSLFPLLIVLFTLLPYIPIPHQDMLGIVRDFAPVEAMDLIEKNVHDIMNHRNGGLLSFGIIGTIWSSSNGINAIVKAFNKAYNVKESRSFIVSRGMAILLTFGMIFVLILAIVLPVFGREIGVFLFSQMGYTTEFIKVWDTLSWLVSAIILFLIFTGLYWIAPNVKIKCRSAFPGAAFATVGWIISSIGLTFYVGNISNYSLTYGSIGAIIVLMIWLYISAFIIILGGEINAFYSEKNRKNC
ncbi:YihY/virulence factor BrkB family protein [Bacillus sp. ISL-40]|uniref:YihY/virulence factor BrkB family protein n=1 Tax=unclassified Bacillus (in: firmicutes) TaxID=185979 RepID=UPI0015D517FA|nr:MULTISPECIES: YihY/virulence factor BrkB family protein [unclassified Bacillus (in: firmicutes)]MBT2697266.1 YihY/virulence factor BrkB family protein [Bacillus sp. ISL-40]MBT2724033.1 YihY/virulence factor BrkB family protein [Bacillus sp. ISL-46]MBT2741917.1 YihY/virulence factor BrkB family protein [Bacillus sp. ISL-77]